MNTTSYLPGQGLFNFVSEYITEEEPSPAPAPSPEPSPAPVPSPEPVVIAEPVNSRNLWLENDKLKKEIDDQGSIIEKLDNRLADVRDEIKVIKYQKSIAVEMCAASGVENDKLKEEIQIMKQEMKVLRSMCGLDRRLKLTKIKEEDLHKYCQYDLKKFHPKYGKQDFSLILINKTRYDLEPTMKNDDTGYKYSPYRGVIPINYTMRFSINEQHYLHPSQGPQYNIIIKSSLAGAWKRGHSATPDLIQNINSYTQFNSLNNDIDEYYLMNITFPKLPDFMKIENMNTLDIDIYKMKGIYVITYE